jgi:DNA-binding response OmpR family regulator
VVILDVRLPDGNGLDLARELGAGHQPRPKILVMSASVLPRDREVALAAGTDGFMGKPFMPRDLIAFLEAFTGPDQEPGGTNARASAGDRPA